MGSFNGSFKGLAIFKGLCTQGVYTLAYFGPASTYRATTVRPKYMLFGYMDP